MLTQPQIQTVRNLALLARQAIANGFASMQSDPRMIADLCQAIEAAQSNPAVSAGNDPSLVTTDTPPAATT